MTFRDHGTWTAYQPAVFPENAPTGSLFAKRGSDGQDWYEYVHPGTNFTPGNVVICAHWSDEHSSYVVSVATRDPLEIFPQGGLVHELLDYAGSDPQEDLGRKLYDPATGVFSDLPPPLAQKGVELDPIMQALAAIQNRLEALERKLGGA